MLVRKSTFEKAKSKLVQELKTNHSLTAEIDRLKENIRDAEQAIREVLPRLLTIDVRRFTGPEYRDTRYRICVDLQRDMVERAFTHGSDDRMIRYMAQQLAHEVERKLIQFNFARCDNLG